MIEPTGMEVATRALCDNWSQVNLITANIVQQLNAKAILDKPTFSGIGGTSLGSSMGEVMVKIKLNDERCIVNKFFVVKHITNYNPQGRKKDFGNLNSKLADKNYHKPGKIHALLGVEIRIQIIEQEIVRSKDRAAIAHKTKLGHIVFANIKDPYQSQNPYIGAITKGASIRELTKIIQKLWEIEDIPNEKSRTIE